MLDVDHVIVFLVVARTLGAHNLKGTVCTTCGSVQLYITKQCYCDVTAVWPEAVLVTTF
jgi:hypothetical protein